MSFSDREHFREFLMEKFEGICPGVTRILESRRGCGSISLETFFASFIHVQIVLFLSLGGINIPKKTPKSIFGVSIKFDILG